jgi:SRSO17 transposase
MGSSHILDQLDICFDDTHAVANAGLLLPATLAERGTVTVGVQRQYTGTAGRMENAQVGVYLVYATDAGHAVVDRELYLPRSWTDDPDRMRAAGVASQVGFATKPKLAMTMIRRALDAGVPASWVAGDGVYGADPRLRAELQARQIG